MEINIRITGDTPSSDLTKLAGAIRVLAGEEIECAGTCSGVTLGADGRLKNISVGSTSEYVPNGTAAAQDAIPETGRPASLNIGNEPLTGHVPETGTGYPVSLTIGGIPMTGYGPDADAITAADAAKRAGHSACSNCGFYGCRCDEFDAEVDTGAIFGGGIDGVGKHPAEGLDTGAIFGGASNPALAPSTAGVAPSTIAPTLPNGATCPPVPGAPTNAASADSTGAIVPTGAATTNLAGVELDSLGLPWDARIHARTKAKVADGTWRMKRGVAPEVVNSVVAELKAAPAAPAAPESIATTSTTPPAVPGAPTAPQLGPFPQLMRELSPFICTADNPNNRISHSGLRQFAASLGLTNPETNEGEVALLQHRHDLIPAFRERVNMHLAQWGESLGA